MNRVMPVVIVTILVGLMVWTICEHDTVEASYIHSPDIGVFAFLTAPDTTTITTGGTYYEIAGTFTNSPVSGFTIVAGPPAGIRYDGVHDVIFEIDWHASVTGDSNGMTVHAGTATNGTSPNACSLMGTYLKVADEAQAFSGTCVLTLSSNDVITLVVTADDDGDLVIVKHFTTSLRRFYR